MAHVWFVAAIHHRLKARLAHFSQAPRAFCFLFCVEAGVVGTLGTCAIGALRRLRRDGFGSARAGQRALQASRLRADMLCASLHSRGHCRRRGFSAAIRLAWHRGAIGTRSGRFGFFRMIKRPLWFQCCEDLFVDRVKVVNFCCVVDNVQCSILLILSSARSC